MRVSNARGQYWRQCRTPQARRAGKAAFSDLLKAGAQGYHRDEGIRGTAATISVNGEQRAIHYLAMDEAELEENRNKESAIFFKSQYYPVKMKGKPAGSGEVSISVKIPRHISDIASPIELHLEHLTEEKRAELNEKFHIEDISPNSPEYCELLFALQQEGVLQDIPQYLLCPGEWLVNADEDGNITGAICYIGNRYDAREGVGLIRFLEGILENPSALYAEILGKEELTDAEGAVLSIYRSNEYFCAALKEIFAGQLG